MPCYKVKTFSKNFFSLKQGPSISQITKVDVTINWQADVHSHSWTEIAFITKGEGRIFIGNTLYPIHKGDLIIINPGILHYEEFIKEDKSNDHLCFYCCWIEDFETSLMPRNHILPIHDQPILKTGEMEERFLFDFNEIFEESDMEKEYYTEICKNLSYEIVMLTLRLLNEKYNFLFQWQSDQYINKVRSFIDKHFTEKINTAMVAKELAISRQSLYRQLHEEKFSPGRYIHQKRIDLAKQLIITSNENLQEIAYKAGYADYSSFFSVFKKTVGLSPNEYRKLHKFEINKSKVS